MRAHRVVARLAAPALSVGHEDALFAAQAVEDGRGLAAERGAIGVERDQEAAQVRDVLAERQLAVDARSGDGFVGVVLLGESLRFGFEAFGVFRGPPIAQAAVGVDLAALVVETVRDLVADHSADRAVVHGRIGARVEQRRLQNAGGEDDLVFETAVIGVHGLRRHAPLFGVRGFADLVELIGELERSAARDVAVKVAGFDFQLRIVAPFHREADHHLHLRKFEQRLRFRRVAHPGELLDALGHRRFQVRDQAFHHGFRRGGEMFGDIFLADEFAEAAFDEFNAAFPTRADLRRALQFLVGELEAAVDEALREERRGVVDDLKRLPGF